MSSEEYVQSEEFTESERQSEPESENTMFTPGTCLYYDSFNPSFTSLHLLTY